jgi:thiol-disulfide isomerase/thioredoxin
MKRLSFLSLLLALWAPGLLAQSLNLTNHSSENLRLRLEVMQAMDYLPIDSLVVAPGETRVLPRKEPYVSFYRVMLVENPKKTSTLYIWDEDVTVALDSTLEMHVTGSARNTAYQAFTREVINPARKILIENTVKSTRLRQQGDSLGADALLEKNGQIVHEVNFEKLGQLSRMGDKDFLYLYWLAREWTGLGIPATKKLLAELSPEWHTHPLYVGMVDKIQKLESVGEGVRMESFTRTTLAGTPLQLSGLGSEYILLDFWGSWCGPCIQAIPKLKKLSTTFPADKLTIVGVAGETEIPSSALRRTIEKHTIYWPQIEELRSSQESLINRFHITFFPTYILLDKNLVIVKRGGSEVLPQIEELLKQ